MSGLPNPPATPPKAPKVMSSRLLTMKFMQRAAASSSPAGTPSTPDGPTPKRQRTGNSSPTDIANDSLTTQAALQDALAQEAAKRQEILDRRAAEAGDTHWVLNFKKDPKISQGRHRSMLRVVQYGYSVIDQPIKESLHSEDDAAEQSPVALAGRKRFGKFNGSSEETKDSNTKDQTDSKSDADDTSIDSEDENSDEDPTEDLIRSCQNESAKKLRESRKAHRKAEEVTSRKLAKSRLKKDVNLNKVKSISARSIAARSVSGPKPQISQQTCFKCGQVGHVKADCPQSSQRQKENQDGRPTKKAKKS